MSINEQMVKTRSLKEIRSLTEIGNHPMYGYYSETREHTVAGCRKIANIKQLTQHSRVLISDDDN